MELRGWCSNGFLVVLLISLLHWFSSSLFKCKQMNPMILCYGPPLVLVHPIRVLHSVFKLGTASPGYTENEQSNTDVQAMYQIGFQYWRLSFHTGGREREREFGMNVIHNHHQTQTSVHHICTHSSILHFSLLRDFLSGNNKHTTDGFYSGITACISAGFYLHQVWEWVGRTE